MNRRAGMARYGRGAGTGDGGGMPMRATFWGRERGLGLGVGGGGETDRLDIGAVRETLDEIVPERGGIELLLDVYTHRVGGG